MTDETHFAYETVLAADWRYVAIAAIVGAAIVAGIVLLVGRSGTDEPE